MGTNLKRLSKGDLAEANSNKTISIYGKGSVSEVVFAAGVVAIKKAFPKLQSGWYDILEETLDEIGFTDKPLFGLFSPG